VHFRTSQLFIMIKCDRSSLIYVRYDIRSKRFFSQFKLLSIGSLLVRTGGNKSRTRSTKDTTRNSHISTRLSNKYYRDSPGKLHLFWLFYDGCFRSVLSAIAIIYNKNEQSLRVHEWIHAGPPDG